MVRLAGLTSVEMMEVVVRVRVRVRVIAISKIVRTGKEMTAEKIKTIALTDPCRYTGTLILSYAK